MCKLQVRIRFVVTKLLSAVFCVKFEGIHLNKTMLTELVK